VNESDFPAQFLSSYVWTKERDTFGGYSAITLSPNGRDFILLSDRSHLIEGSIFRHGDQIIGVRSREMTPLAFPEAFFKGNPLRKAGKTRDTEGLAMDGSGRLYVSLESDNAILRRTAEGGWEKLPTFPQIGNLPPNRGLEALAVAADDAVFAIPEMSAGLKIPFPVFRYTDEDGWDVPFQITRTHGFLPVGADFGSDGLLYVLERGFDGFGFFSRVRRFAFDGDAVSDGETLLMTRRRRHDNLEGLAVWQTVSGELRLTMVSDDNFNRFQKTEIVEYGLPL
jgi:hypothetical protein